MATPNTVVLHARDRDPRDGIANATITPGELIEVTGTSGSERLVQPHSSAPSTDTEGSALPRFALEYAKTGKGIDEDYPTDDAVEYRTCQTGDVVYTFINTGENASIDDPLESAGNGSLSVHTGSSDADTTSTQTYYDGAVVGHALESVDNSGGSSPVRIRVEVR